MHTVIYVTVIFLSSFREILFWAHIITVNVTISLRARFGTCDLRNAVHGSESFSAAEREIRFMFPNCE